MNRAALAASSRTASGGLVQKLDISVRRELFVASSWSWDDEAGATVRFYVDDAKLRSRSSAMTAVIYFSKWMEARFHCHYCRIRTDSSSRIICLSRSVMPWITRLSGEWPDSESTWIPCMVQTMSDTLRRYASGVSIRNVVCPASASRSRSPLTSTSAVPLWAKSRKG